MAERRLRCVLVRTCDICTANLDMSVYLIMNYFTSAVNCPLIELDLYHVTCHFIIELHYSPLRGMRARIRIPRIQFQYFECEYYSRKEKRAVKKLAGQEIVLPAEFSPVLPQY